MRYFFAFLIKNHFFFLFLLLEILSFSFIIKHNRYQGSKIINATNQITGSVFTGANNVSDYFKLSAINRELSEEIAKLKTASFNKKTADNSMTPQPDTNYKFLCAKVINNSTNRHSNYLMLDKGSNHGVEADMGVVSNKGIVGIVIGVSGNYCTVMSVIHKNAKISAKIKKNLQLVNLIWNERSYKKGTLTDIPTHIDLKKGDTIITSGFSFIFPEGIMIGTFENYKTEKGESLNSAVLNFSTDFNNLNYVYVIQNINKKEQIKLTKNSQHE